MERRTIFIKKENRKVAAKWATSIFTDYREK